VSAARLQLARSRRLPRCSDSVRYVPCRRGDRHASCWPHKRHPLSSRSPARARPLCRSLLTKRTERDWATERMQQERGTLVEKPHSITWSAPTRPVRRNPTPSKAASVFSPDRCRCH